VSTTAICEACRRSQTVEEFDPCNIEIPELLALGWIKRVFAPNVEVWFCGPTCAYLSWRAREIEDCWRTPVPEPEPATTYRR
jgi:hypothetical protein